MASKDMQFSWVRSDEIRPNPFQPRERMDKEGLRELASSIKNAGLVQPIIVRKHGKSYQIIAGERRWRALQMAGQKKVPVIIEDIAEENILLHSLIENLHRQDLTDIERENAIHELWSSKRFKTRSALAQATGADETRVTADIEAYEFRRKERVSSSISTEALKATRPLPTHERKQVLEKVAKGKMGVRELYTVSRVLRKAPESIKRELLKTKPSITPEAAETIIDKLPSKEEQEIVLREAKQYRLTEDEIEDRVRDITRSREQGITPAVERVTIVQGQWLYDRISKPSEELLSINIDAHTELTEEQKKQIARLLKTLQTRITQWLQRLDAIKVMDIE